MNIALIGYGKMGKAIEQIATERGHQVKLIISSNNLIDLNATNLAAIDLAIDFSIPSQAKNNIVTALKANTTIISGTTGWLDDYDEVVELCNKSNAAFLYASNFSLGVNLFFELNKNLAHLMKPHKEYDVNLTEVHHTQKLDAPSGTAITLAEQIISENKDKQAWTLEGAKSAADIEITAHREPEVPGTHIVNYASEIDTITIKHEAHNRKGFALGAVIAAEWILNKKGVFTMQDVLFKS